MTDPLETVEAEAERGDSFRQAVVKALVVGPDQDVPASTVGQPDDTTKGFTEAGAIEPPFNPWSLTKLVEHSDSLRQCIEAYTVNIEAFGHRWEPVIDLESDDAREKVRAAIEVDRGITGAAEEVTDEEVDAKLKEIVVEMRRERFRLDAFFGYCSITESFPELRQRTRQDEETTGNGYWEVLRDSKTGEVAQFAYVAGYTMRLLPLDSEATPVDEYVRISPFTITTIHTRRRLRRYVQILEGKRTYFKEFGDPRVISRRTGKVWKSVDDMEAEEEHSEEAAEVVHFKIHSPRTPYGVPRWIGCLIAVLGSRKAEEVNLLYFDHKGVPPMAILVSGGTVNDATVNRIKDFIKNEIQGSGNFHKILVLDSAVADDGTINSGRAKIEIKPLTAAQHNDALFQNYNAQNTEKVGSAFRLPRILRGDSREVNRATAEAALAFAEIQVFGPLREQFDFWMNRQILSRMGVRFWRFRSNAPSLRDPTALAGVVRDLVNAGVLVPSEARELAEGIFNREFRYIEADWTRLPLALTLAGMTPEGWSNVAAPPAPGESGGEEPGVGASGAPDEKRPPASQNSGANFRGSTNGAAWLKRMRDAARRRDAGALLGTLYAIRDEFQRQEEADAEDAFRSAAGAP